MCTAISLTSKEHYFGRNLDLDRSYGEEVAVMPRKFPLTFKKSAAPTERYAIIGMATVVQRSKNNSFKKYGGLPLFYDAVNEHGLAIAGLNFPHNAYYVPLADCEKNNTPIALPLMDSADKRLPAFDTSHNNPSASPSKLIHDEPMAPHSELAHDETATPIFDFEENKQLLSPPSSLENRYTVAPFEVIPWILRQCKSVREAVALMERTTVADISFSDELPATPLHWMLSDKEQNAVIEPMRDGLKIYNNSIGVLTNNPPLKYQLENLEKYWGLKPDNDGASENTEAPYSSASYGLGAVGLPGDVSSKSRFVRAAFFRKNSVSDEGELNSVGQFFHLLSSVEVARGICKTDEGKEHFTVYSSCINTERALYYYTTYGNRRISCVDMRRCDLDGEKISRFNLTKKQNVFYQN